MENYHKHTSYSNLFPGMDSIVSYEDYAKRAVELGHKALTSVEHGWQGAYHKCYNVAKKYGLKFVFGVEAYWVKDRLSHEEKSAHHIIILAKNEKGRQAINDILSTANEDGYYYRPRIDLELIFTLPPSDVFITTACVAFYGYPDIEDIIVQMHDYFGDNFMLEIQYHNTEKQINLNKQIREWAYKYNIKMIAGLDSHYIYPEESELRDEALLSKNIHYEDEEGWYMDYPSDEECLRRFQFQNIFTVTEILERMKNSETILTFEDYDDVPIFNHDVKLPSIYPDKTQEEKNKIYSRLITKLFKERMKTVPESDYNRYFNGVKEEVQTYKDTGMVDYPLLNYQIIKRGIENGGVITDTGRGSAVGFYTNTLCGFSKVDRFKSAIKIYPERFMSTTRILETKSLPD